VKISVRQESDWSAIARLGGPVVDPMIVRCGEIFLRGSSGAEDAGSAWDLLTRNVHAIGTFFDRLILDEQIPVFNYADTFDMGQNFNERTLSAVNADEEILVDVDVGWEAYQQVRSAAFAEMRKLYEGGQARVTRSEAENILGELSASGYAWYPRLDDLALRNDDEKKLAGFIFGGLIFGGYAQLAGTDHLMQPKRSRLFLAISLKEQTSREGEEQIFAKLGELVGRPTAEIPYTPTFFPLLLGRSSGPADLLKNALDMRSSAEVRDYRAWLGEALADFDTNGRIPVARAREVSKIASAIQRKVDGFPFPKVEIKVTVADVVAAKPPGIGIDLTAPAKAAWGWLVTQLPGKRHRKLLTRAVVADREYLELDRRVHTVWSGAALDT
jgi:hypothetical protein